MTAKVILSVFCLVVLTAFTVFATELIAPLAKKADLNVICSGYLKRMEAMNGLSYSERQELIAELEDAGYSVVSVAGTAYAKKGEKLTLSVKVKVTCRGIAGLFEGRNKLSEIRYEKSTVARKIYN